MPGKIEPKVSPAIAAARALIDGSRHQVRLSRMGTERAQVKYEGPASLYIQRAGVRVVAITPVGLDWAEASEQDGFFANPGSLMPDSNAVSGILSFMVEDYLLQILD